MLLIHMLQNLYDLSDMKVMNEILDSCAFAAFCCINSPEEVTNGDTIGRFRNLLLEHELQKQIFDEVVRLITERGLILKKGMIVDSTFIEAPFSTKTRRKREILRRIQRKKEIHVIWGTKHISVEIAKALWFIMSKQHQPMNMM